MIITAFGVLSFTSMVGPKTTVTMPTSAGNGPSGNAAIGAPPPPLKGTKKLAAEKSITNLDSAFDASPRIDSDIVVYRGMNMTNFTNDKGNLSTLMTDKGVVSTSLDFDVGRKFAKANPTGNMAVMEITIPKGTKAIVPNSALTKFTEFRSERELMLPPGSSFRLISFKKRKGVNVLQAELVAG